MRNLSLTLTLGGLIAAAVATGPAAFAKPASDAALAKATSLPFAALTLPATGLRDGDLELLVPGTATRLTQGVGGQGLAAPRGFPVLAPKDEAVALSYSCTGGGYCCFWFFESRSPYCG